MKKDGVSLKEMFLFQGLSRDQARELKGSLREKPFEKGDMLSREGQPCQRICLIRKGCAKVYKAGSGKEQTLHVLYPGDACICHPGRLPWRCSASVRALTPGLAWFLSKDLYASFVAKNPKLSRTLNALLAKRVLHLNSLIQGITLEDARSRLIALLLEMLTEGGSQRTCQNALCFPYAREEIARNIAATRETVSRHLSELRRRRLIDLEPGRILILDRGGLKKLLSREGEL